LLQLGRLNVLTDPIWSGRASPLRWIGPRRPMAPAVDFDALPAIDVVLLSHKSLRPSRCRDRAACRRALPGGGMAVSARARDAAADVRPTARMKSAPDD
jgi:hypothetical protein